MTNKAILTGLLAGIAAGLCVLATVNMGPVAYFLMFIAAGAVGVATMGWGRDAGIAATVAAFGVLVLASGLPIAAASTLLLFVPAGWTGYLANLGHRRPGEAAVDWYPLGRILLHLMALLAFAFIAVGYADGITGVELAKAFTELFRELAARQPDLPGLDEAGIARMAQIYARLLPLVAPGMWLLTHVLTAFIAAGITRRSGLMARARDDVAAGTILPLEAGLFVLAGLAGVLVFDGALNLAGSVLLSLAVCGYALVGLAQLHLRLRGNPAALLILIVAYGSILIAAFPILVFALMGLLRSHLPSGPHPPTPKST